MIKIVESLREDIVAGKWKSGSEIKALAHLLDGRASAGDSVDSARQNIAATFANAFVNAGFDQVKLFRINFPVNADALLGVGIVNCSIENDCDPHFWTNILTKKIPLSELVQ